MVLELVDGYQADAKTDPKRIKFKCIVNDKYKEIVAYNQIDNYIENDDSFDRNLTTTSSHRYPTRPTKARAHMTRTTITDVNGMSW